MTLKILVINIKSRQGKRQRRSLSFSLTKCFCSSWAIWRYYWSFLCLAFLPFGVFFFLYGLKLNMVGGAYSLWCSEGFWLRVHIQVIDSFCLRFIAYTGMFFLVTGLLVKIAFLVSVNKTRVLKAADLNLMGLWRWRVSSCLHVRIHVPEEAWFLVLTGDSERQLQ